MDKRFGIIMFICLLALGFFGYRLIDQRDPIMLAGTPVDINETGNNVLILIPGHGGSTESVTFLAQYMQKQGWEIHLLDIGDGTGSLTAYADKLKQFIGTISAERSINIIGYSAGGIVARISLADPRVGSRVYRAVSIASPHAGTKIADIGERFGYGGCGETCKQLTTTSSLLEETPNEVFAEQWLNIYINNDEAIQPSVNAYLRGATNINISDLCEGNIYTHNNVVKDPNVAYLVSMFLNNGRAAVTNQTCL